MKPAQVPANNVHLNKLLATDMKAVPGTDSFSMLYFGLSSRSPTLSNGKPLAEFSNVLSGGDCIVLLGPSGAGKTRKLFELLSTHHGYFLSYRGANDKNPGSHALAKVLSPALLQSTLAQVDWVSVQPSRAVYDQRRRAVHFAVKCVLAAYVFVYHEWCAKLGSAFRRGSMTAFQWLLVQLFPNHFFGDDIFATLALELFEKCDPMISISIDRPQGFLCAIDEAQVFGSILVDSFNTQDPRTSLRPLLSPVISGVEEALGRFPIICGTGLSLSTEWRSIVSRQATKDDLARFVFCDFPPLEVDQVRKLLLSLLNCERDARFAEAAEWLSGRPRYTTYFIETAIEKNLSVSELLDNYVAEMTLPPSRAVVGSSRTPAQAFERLGAEPAEFKVVGTLVANPFESALMDAYWVSQGLMDRLGGNPALIELGLGFAGLVDTAVSNGIDGRLVSEPLVLESAFHFRAQLSRFGERTLQQVQDSDSEMGSRFEYLATERIVQCLTKGPLQDCALLGDLGKSLPPKFQGIWEVPSRRCGRMAFTGDDGVFEWFSDVLDPLSSTVRSRFPGNFAGPDALVVLSDSDHKRVLILSIQEKFRDNVDVTSALLTTDLSKLYHVNRGEPMGTGKGQEHVTKKYDEGLKALLARIGDTVPVVRILVSGASTISSVSSGLVPHSRGPIGGHDLLLVVDNSKLDDVFGARLAAVLRGLKT